MTVQEILVELDKLIIEKLGSLDEALNTERGQELFLVLTSETRRQELIETYGDTIEMNDLARGIKQKIEKSIGKKLG
ncbi:hypothetical protein [Gimesia panareensis]|uniref:Uncharacterized protein n=1 Tax=Gimesia panareensis TaxID=2527978 RepID=A0A517Q9Q4_9PLAN|nr:hypothetical protein [Gimesia panareensis]QDT28357.1 hypothetical protein Enr10x_36990 [Gimesia panareensis]QDU51225.1 hypothetical protein Pan110_35890 [Gimesia panareensis]